MAFAMKERIQKLMAAAGVASRRGSEALIRAGRVRINGRVAAIGEQADLGTDVIEVDGVRLQMPEARVYFAINKPRNVLTAGAQRADETRRTVTQLLPYKGRLFSIGRLDADSDGLVVLTNDGDMAQKLSHPRFRHTKTYRVVVAGLPTAETLERWQNGVHLEEGRTAPCYVKVVRGNDRESILKVVMTEGRKRQIRRVAMILGHPVLRLTRTAIGCLDLEHMKTGEWRELTGGELKLLVTPAPELKIIRKRAAERRSTAERPDGEATQPRGTRRDDDVRSDRQRRSARGEGDGWTVVRDEPRERRRSSQEHGRPSRQERGRASGREETPLERPRRPAGGSRSGPQSRRPGQRPPASRRPSANRKRGPRP